MEPNLRVAPSLRQWYQQPGEPAVYGRHAVKQRLNWQGPASAYRLIIEPKQSALVGPQPDLSRPDNDDFLTPVMSLYSPNYCSRKQSRQLFSANHLQTCSYPGYQRQ